MKLAETSGRIAARGRHEKLSAAMSASKAAWALRSVGIDGRGHEQLGLQDPPRLRQARSSSARAAAAWG